MRTLDGTSIARLVTFSPDGKTLAIATYGDTIQLWDMVSKSPIDPPLTGHTDLVSSIAFSPDGQTLASSSWDTTVRLWDVASRRPAGLPLTGDPVAVEAVAFGQDGKILISGDRNGTIMVWNTATGDSPISHHYTYKGAVQSAVFSSDGKTIFLGNEYGQILLQDSQTGKQITTLDTTFYPVRSLQHGADEDLRTIQSLALSRDGRTLASGRLDGTVILWDMVTKTPFAQFILPNRLQKMMLSGDGQTVAASGDGHTFALWSVKKRAEIPLSLTHQFPVNTFALSPDGRFLAAFHCSATENTSVCDASQIVLWDVVADKLIGRPPTQREEYISDLAFSPDGRTLAWSSAFTGIFLWDISTSKPVGHILSISTGKNVSGCYNKTTFSPNGQLLVSYASFSPCFILWDETHNEPFIQSIDLGNYGNLSNMAFSPGGQQFATIGVTGDQSVGGLGGSLNPHEGVVTIWDFALESWEQSACTIANRNLTEQEWNQFIDHNSSSYSNVCPLLPAPSTIIGPLIKQLEQANTAAQAGHGQEAAGMYKKLADRAIQLNDADFNNTVCWEGSVRQFAQLVFPACEEAVKLAPDNADYRDSLGLARALTGDTTGAIADFQFFVDRVTATILNLPDIAPDTQKFYQHLVDERKAWIQVLKAGNNPFDEKTLHDIQDE
jgi:WD40 repeat protein